MKVVVDTSIWSLALRRRRGLKNPQVETLRQLIANGHAALLGVVRQEILSGIRHVEQYDRLKNELRAFPDLAMDTEDYELAAGFFNTCRGKGLQGANADFLICATANRRGYPIFTADDDFGGFGRYLPIVLFTPRTEA